MSSALISWCTAAALATSGAAPGVAIRTIEPTPSEAVAPAPAPAPAPASDPAAALAPASAAEPAPAPASDPAAALAPAPTAEPAPATPTAAPTVVLQPAPDPMPAAPPPAAPPPASLRDGTGMIAAGAIMMGVGAASLLFVSAPSAIVRDVAQSRADRADALAFTSREHRYGRARRADDAMEAGFWIGAPLLVGGLAVLLVGVSMRTKATAAARERARLSAAPGGVAVRF